MDNSNLGAKLDLRRHFLKEWHPPGQRRVFDGFQGGRVIWSILESEFPLDSYWGVDLLPKKGRLKIDSARILSQPGWKADVVDLDAYGSPWAHWLGLLATAQNSLSVFLTLGSRGGIQKRPLTKVEKHILGIPFDIPPAIGGQVVPHVIPALMGKACERFNVVSAIETDPGRHARYFGLRLDLK